MKRLSCALLLALGILLLADQPSVTNAQQIPLEKTTSGASEITYAGQTFRVSATVPVRIRFELLSPTAIKLTFVSDTGANGRLTVYWLDFQKYIFTGQMPVSVPWEGTLDTEGGFVDR